MKRTVLLALVASLALAGCGALKSTATSARDTVGGWFSWSDDARVKPTPLGEIPAGGPGLREVWKADPGTAGASLFRPVADADSVYAAGTDSVSRFSLDSGRRLWRTEGLKLVGGTGLGGGLVLAGSRRGELVALDAATGAQRWAVRLTSELAGVPLVVGDTVVVRSGDGLVRGVAASSGQQIWQFSRNLPALTLRDAGGMAALDGRVYIGFPGGKLVALDAARGTQLWEATVALPRGATELERIADVMGPPVISGPRVCAAAYQGRLACFDRESGAPAWARDASTHVGVAGDDYGLYHVDDTDAVSQHDYENGRSTWRQEKLAHRKLSPPLVFDERWVIVGDAEGWVHVLARDDGRLVARIRADGPVIAAPVDIGPGFAVQTAKGTVHAYRIN